MDKTPEEIEYERRWIEAEYEVMGWWPKLNPNTSNSDEPFFDTPPPNRIDSCNLI